MIDSDICGDGLEECGCAFSEQELSQIIADDEIKTKMKVCPICSVDFVDNSYFGEVTCGSKSCIEEYERIYGKRSKKKL